MINNITHSITGAYLGACPGCVVAYNYNFGSYYTDGSQCVDPTNTRNSTCNWPAFITTHEAGGGMYLFEGNQVNGMYSDTYHGSSPLDTMFRNYFRGTDDQGGKSFYQWAVRIEATSRAHNFVGNVLGDPTLSMIYSLPLLSGYPNQSQPAIYNFGYSNGLPSTDPLVESSTLRWGNYDTVNATVRWLASEVPTTGIPRVNGNPVPANHNLPNSFFLASQPTAWWATPWGTPSWPPIGPDVTGGNPALGGHVYDIPAKLCFTHLSNDPAFSGAKLFNATNCYSSSGSSTTLPIVTLTIQ